MVFKQTIKTFLERFFPEKRLFVRTEHETRFVRLGPGVQIFATLGITLFVMWSIIATAIVLIDTIGSGSFREQAKRDQRAYEERLNTLSTERDSRAKEAVAAQERFTTALQQVSSMQSQLLASEDQRRELERGVEVVQSALRRAIDDREAATAALVDLQKTLSGENNVLNAQNSAEDTERTLSYMSDTLQNIAMERDQATADAMNATDQLTALDLEMQHLERRNDAIFRQLEDAMTISVKPLDRMFKNAGLNPTTMLNAVKRGYSGQGGALSPISFTSINSRPSPDEERANNILSQLDNLNLYRIAASRAPFALPVKDNFRYTSGFGPRWGRMHKGVDLAAPYGTAIYATADGIVTKAGRGSGYGRVIYIKHAYGIETRYAHLSRIRVKVGERVSRGQRIGDMGNSGRSTGTHLHYEVRVNTKAVNPMIYIKAANNVF